MERLDPADPPDDGAPSACLCLPLAAVPVRACLGAAKVTSPDNFSDFTRACLEAVIVTSPDKVSDFTTVPRSVGAWLLIPPVAGRGSRPALELAGRVMELSQWLAGMVFALIRTGKRALGHGVLLYVCV